MNETTTLSPAEQVLADQQERLLARRRELQDWFVHYSPDRHSAGQLKGWAEEIERIDFAFNELGLARRAVRELG